MKTLLFAIAVICMVTGHIFKVKRWGLLIAVYEEPCEPNLLNAMTLGHALNTLLPIRIGELVRSFWAGRKLKNGFSFALATVVADLYIDMVTVSAMFFILSLTGKGGEKLLVLAHFYMWVFLIILLVTLLCVVFRKALKYVIRAIAGIFNKKIEFRLLYISYLCITSIKDITKNIKKSEFLIYTICIWLGYVSSYVLIAEALQQIGFAYTATDIFTKLFSLASLYYVEEEFAVYWGVYLLLPIGICWIISMVRSRTDPFKVKRFRTVLPQMNREDQYAFLKIYYKEENRNHIQAYLGINKDVTVVEDNSAGSNASTVLVMKSDGNLFYRKYAFDEDGIKLNEQINWIEEHQMVLPLPVIMQKRNENHYVTYDMHSYVSAVGLFRYIHTMPIENSWKVLRRSLDDVKIRLHTRNVRSAKVATIRKYINDKVLKTLKIIEENNKYIKALEQYDFVWVNGQSLPTIGNYMEMLQPEHLEKIFSGDYCADIHGDLTVENIICLLDASEVNEEEYFGKTKPDTYYFIDPNVGNIHDSPFLDYGKLLQSLHGNYEFLMMVTSVEICKNQIEYMMIKSEAYGRLYDKYREYLQEEFNREQILSIYYHEVVHWLRLMPYKIRKNEKMAVVFYTGLLMVLKDVWEMEYGTKR